MFCLQSDTDPSWVTLVKDNLDKLLADHAYCERKAAASAMSLIGRFPDDRFLVPQLIKLAQEEMEHFERLYQVLTDRNLPLGFDSKDPYVTELLPLGRQGGVPGLIDRLLISSLIEARSAERFFLLAEHLDDAELRAMYKELAVSESRHYGFFVHLASHYAPREEVEARLAELAAEEAAIVARLPVQARMH